MGKLIPEWSIRASSGVKAAVFFAAFTMTADAAAFERQQHLGGAVGGAMVKGSDGPVYFGGGAGAHYAYGLKDNWNFMAEVAGSGVPLRSSQNLFAWSAAAGISYAFDVVEWVPYAGMLAGGYLLHGKGMGDAVVAPGAQAALGLDYQFSRSFAVGLALRQHFVLTKLDTFPVYTTALLRAEYVWGW